MPEKSTEYGIDPAKAEILAALRRRIDGAGRSARGNLNVAEFLEDGDLAAMENVIAGHVHGILQALAINIADDHNAAETPERVARMFVREMCAGRFEPRPKVTCFENVRDIDQLYAVGPIAVRSCCAHHLCPIEGEAWCGVIPTDRVVGLSKFSRLASWIMARPQMQEEATVQLADEIEEAIRPRGLAVVVRARHTCMTWRGVRDRESLMTTSVTRGALRDSSAARAEFFAMIGGQGFACR
jgi:GTP cyclohydrolase I